MRILTLRHLGEIPSSDEINLPYSMEIIKSSCYYLSACRTSQQSRILRPFLVYCFKKINEKILPLNRDYKPIGLISGRYVKYEEYEFLMLQESSIKDFNKISNEQGYSGLDYFTWSDDCSPFLNSVTRKRYLTLMQDLLYKK